jgi:gluconokinase
MTLPKSWWKNRWIDSVRSCIDVIDLHSGASARTGFSCGRALEMLSSGMALTYPTLIPGLRSPFDQVKGIVYFGRMLDKIRLAAAGKLPEGWRPMRGTAVQGTFDSRCCKFLHIEYSALEAETLKGGSDEELLAWASAHGRQPTEQEIEVWNAFMTKRGWRDAGTQRLNERLAEIGLPPGTVQTMFEFIDLDEGRRQVDPR